MKKNVGRTDMIVRILVAVLIAVLFFTNVLSGILAIILGVFAVIMLITGLVGFCPLYTICGIGTCPMKKD